MIVNQRSTMADAPTDQEREHGNCPGIDQACAVPDLSQKSTASQRSRLRPAKLGGGARHFKMKWGASPSGVNLDVPDRQ